MAELVTMPRFGQSMEEGTVVQWFKKEGDEVNPGEPLLEVMSDKANFEVEAEVAGTLRKILAGVNDSVPVNQPIAIVGAPDEPIDADFSEAPQSSAVPPSSTIAPASSEPVIRSTARTPVSPRARRLADESGVPVSALQNLGTGPGGRVLERDVLAYLQDRRAPETESTPPAPARVTPLAAKVAQDLGIEMGDLSLGLPGSRVTAEVVRRRADRAPAAPPSPAEPRVAERIPMRGLRKLVADNVTRSRQSAPHVTLTMEVDVTELAALLPALQGEIQAAYGTRATYTDVIARAAARALDGHGLCNAALIEDEVVVYEDKNIGIAVATDSGLLVPVIRNADRRPLGEISAELKQMAARCREGRPNPADLSGGTFTITNLGAFGIEHFDPIIVPPQSCILGVGAIAEKIVAHEGSAVVRSRMNLCLSFDHRVLDGAPAARFLQRLKILLETPALCLL